MLSLKYSLRWRRWAYAIAGVLTMACAWPIVAAARDYVRTRNRMIEWDFDTIERLCGGETDEERLLDIRFVRPWEYRALKKTSDGKQVWIHWRLSKRHCGNWGLVDPNQAALIRPFRERFPNGVPARGAVDCLGGPIDETERWERRDLLLGAFGR